MDRLVIGDTLPQLTLHLIDGSTLALPKAIATRYLMLQFYRGVW